MTLLEKLTQHASRSLLLEQVTEWQATDAQQRLWALTMLLKTTTTHQKQGFGAPAHVYFAYSLQGKLCLATLRKALSSVLVQYPILQSTFWEVDGKLYQGLPSVEATCKITAATATYSYAERVNAMLSYVDVRQFSIEDQPKRLLQLAHEQETVSLSLPKGQLLHLILAQHDTQITAPQSPLSKQISGDNHLLYGAIHHAIADGASVDIFIRTWLKNYIQLAHGEVLCPTPRTRHFGHFAQQEVAQLSTAQEDTLTQAKSILVAQAPLNLPYDHKRPQVYCYEGAVWEQQCYLSLAQSGQRCGVTAANIALAACQCWVYWATEQSQFQLGSMASLRRQSWLVDTIGLLSNKMVIPCKVDPEATFKDLAQQTQQIAERSFEWAALPFDKLVTQLNIPTHAAYHPLFQLMFVYQSVYQATHKLPTLTATLTSRSVTYANYDLSIELEERGEGQLAIICQYNTNLFTQATITTWMGAYGKLLHAVAQQPNAPISTLLASLRRPVAQLQGVTYPLPYKHLMQAFAATVAKYPDRVAVTDHKMRCTYAHLDQWSNHVAHQLFLPTQLDTKQAIVAIMAPRSAAYLACMLGIWKQGAVYLPIDPALPLARKKQLLSASNCTCLIIDDALQGGVSEIYDGPIYTINQLLASPQSTAATEIVAATGPFLPTQLAYIMFTSGSTGVPKGAMINHLGLINHLYGKVVDLQLDHNDHIAQTATQNFDIHIWQFLVALLVGGRVIIYQDEEAVAIATLLGRFITDKITIWETVPSLLSVAIAQQPLLSQYLPLRYLLLTGEALSKHLCEKWLAHYPQIPIINAYGPTECSDDVTHGLIDTKVMAETASSVHTTPHIPIGKPIINTRAYIIRPPGTLANKNEVGQIAISGYGVGQGYINSDSAVFTTNPYHTPGDDGYERLYLTGDLGYIKQGQLYFLGRADQQVKLHGQRIELQEITAVLQKYPLLKQAYVTVYENEPSQQKYLLGYYNAPQPLLVADIKQYMAQHLPHFMVPASLIYVAQWPITHNGKLDTKALPLPTLPRPAAQHPPRTSHQKLVAQTWAKVLDCPVANLAVDDDFFALGGDSLRAIQVVALLQAEHQLHVPLRDLYLYPTLAQLANHLTTLQAPSSALVVPFSTGRQSITVGKATSYANQRASCHLDLPQLWMIHPGHGSCEVYGQLAQDLGNKFCCYGVDNYNLYSTKKINTLQQLAQHYLNIITQTTPMVPPIQLLGWSLGGQIALEMAYQLEQSGFSLLQVYLLDTCLPDATLRSNVGQAWIRNANQRYLQQLAKQGHTADDIAQLTATLQHDQTLFEQGITGKLVHAKLLLLKAGQAKLAQSDARLESYIQQLPTNNMAQVATHPDQIQVITIDTATHWDLLTHVGPYLRDLNNTTKNRVKSVR